MKFPVPSVYTAVVVRKELEPSLTKLRGLCTVDGDAVYDGAEEGEFYKLSCVFMLHGVEEEFIKMLHDPNPVVRVMGIWCLNKSDREKYRKSIKSMYRDRAEVAFVPCGCLINVVSVGDIAKQIIKDPHLLDGRHEAAQQR